MRGDFSRLVFDPKSRYTGVLMQQGRPSLDADWNTALQIQAHYERLFGRDQVGKYGAPQDHQGFEITVSGNDLVVGKGRYYVWGLLCENFNRVSVSSQPFLPSPIMPTAPGSYLAYLDVWPRSVTWIDDPDLLEVALDGVDTTERLQSVWQVKLLPLSAAPTDCADVPSSPVTPGTVGATLAVRVQPGGEVGNWYYLVQIHDAPDPSPPASCGSFKWSRTNGSQFYPVEAWDASTGLVRLGSPGPALDGTLGPGTWIEYVDESIELGAVADPLWQVVSVDPLLRQLTVTGEGTPPMIDLDLCPQVLVWDQTAGPSASTLDGGSVPITPDSWLDLEDGIQVRFTAGAMSTGDYWNAASRTQLGGVEWPEPDGELSDLPKMGPTHRYAPLAVVERTQSGWKLDDNCPDLRTVFASLAQLTERITALEARLGGSAEGS